MNIYIDYTAVTELENDIGEFTGAGNYTRDLISLLEERGVDLKILVHKGFIPGKRWETEHISDESCMIRIGDITDLSFSEGDVLLLPAVTGRIFLRIKRIRTKKWLLSQTVQ